MRLGAPVSAQKVIATVAVVTVLAGSAAPAVAVSRSGSPRSANRPTNVAVRPKNGSVTVSWQPPAAAAAVTGYDVELVPLPSNRVPSPVLGSETTTVDATARSSSFRGLLEDCHQRYEIRVSARTASGVGASATSSSFRPSGIVARGSTPPYVVILVDGIDSQQPGFAMDPYKPTLDGTPSYCPESWNAATATEAEADFAGQPNGPWSFFHKWNHGETDENGNPKPGPIFTASEPKLLNGDGSAQTDTHSFMLDAIAARGAVILPFSYHDTGAKLTSSGHGDPTFTYPRYTQAESDPIVVAHPTGPAIGIIDTYADLLRSEVRSVLAVWPTTKIVIVGHSQGGLVAFRAWAGCASKNAATGCYEVTSGLRTTVAASQLHVFSLDSPINGVCAVSLICGGPPSYPDYGERGTYDEGPSGYLGMDAASGETMSFVGTYGDSPAIQTGPDVVHGPPLRAYGTGSETLEHQMPFDYIARTSDDIEANCNVLPGAVVNPSCPAFSLAPPDHISECPVDYYSVAQWIIDTGHFIVKYCPGVVAYFNQVLDLTDTPTPNPPSSNNRCSAPGAAEGGGPLSFTTTGLSCRDGEGVVTTFLQQLPQVAPDQQQPSIDVLSFTCRVVSPGPLQPGSGVTCTKGAENVSFNLPG